jgi:hypothetical protein
MATLAQQRAAIAAGMTASRAPTGEAERNAIGKRMIEERTGKALVDDVNALIRPERQARTLRTVPLVGAVPAKQGRGDYTPPPATPTGGGIASPLTERTRVEGGEVVPDRDLHPEAVYASSDGLFTMLLQPIKTLRWADANNALGQIDLAAP